ncbi:MAG: 2-hydroxy-acid oxidase, partial [Alicyclobacillus sp.]|nr:2-hydroxy-acid oxidase [Alicyclobacillus sp.]
QALWELRHNALYALMHQYPGWGHLSTDVCVPISKLPEAVLFAQQQLQASGIHGAIIGHVGDGNFHVSIAVNPHDPDNLARTLAYSDQLVQYALQLGGTCTGEHGVGLGKKKFQAKEHGPALDVMRSIKHVLDPLHIMNPGKLVDD